MDDISARERELAVESDNPHSIDPRQSSNCRITPSRQVRVSISIPILGLNATAHGAIEAAVGRSLLFT